MKGKLNAQMVLVSYVVLMTLGITSIVISGVIFTQNYLIDVSKWAYKEGITHKKRQIVNKLEQEIVPILDYFYELDSLSITRRRDADTTYSKLKNTPIMDLKQLLARDSVQKIVDNRENNHKMRIFIDKIIPESPDFVKGGIIVNSDPKIIANNKNKLYTNTHNDIPALKGYGDSVLFPYHATALK